MNQRWLIALAIIAALGSAFILGGATVLVGRDLLTAQAGTLPFIAGTINRPAAQSSDGTETTSEDKGIVVVDVQDDSPAARAGLQRGDILLAIDESETNSVMDVRAAIEDYAAGDSVTLYISRGGVNQELTATLSDLEEGVFLGIQACGAGMGRVFSHAMGGGAGALITEVAADSPAADAGLQADEVIIAVNGTELNHPMALGELIGEQAPGDTITLTVRGTDESERDVELTLGANPEDESKAYLGVHYQPNMKGERMWRGGDGEEGFGFAPDFTMPFDELIPPHAEGEDYAALVVAQVEEGSAAERAGLQRGDHITEVDGKPIAELVESERDVSTIFADYAAGDSVTLTVRRSGEAEALSISATLDAAEDGGAVLGIQAGFVVTRSSEAPVPGGMIPAPPFDIEPGIPETQA